MKSITLLIILWGFLITWGCKQNQNHTSEEFPEIIELSGNEIPMDTSFYGGAHFIELYDSIMTIMALKEKKFLYLFNKNTHTLLASTGKKGRGPGEFINVVAPSLDKKQGVIYLPARGKMKIMKFYIDSLLSNPAYKPQTFINIPSNLRTKMFFKPYKKDLFGYRSIKQNDKLISFFNRKGKIIDSLNVPNNLNVYPELNEQIRRMQVNYFFAFHPIKPLVCIAYRYADVVAIVDMKGNIINKIQGPDQINQTPRYGKDLINTYNSPIRADGQYIYCLYTGNIPIKDQNRVLYKTQYLHIFNWKGEPVMRIKFDHPVHSFIIDKQNKRIITYSFNKGKLFSYKFPL